MLYFERIIKIQFYEKHGTKAERFFISKAFFLNLQLQDLIKALELDSGFVYLHCHKVYVNDNFGVNIVVKKLN